MSISVAPSCTANAVSAVLTSIKVCEEGKPPLTQAICVASTSKESATILAKLGYTQIVANAGSSGCASAKLFTFSTRRSTLSCESVTVSVVSSTAAKSWRNVSGVLYSAFRSSKSFVTAACTCSSLIGASNLAKACSYLFNSWCGSSWWQPQWQCSLILFGLFG